MRISNLLSLLGLAALKAEAAPGATAVNETFNNPVIYSDYPDNDILRGPDGAYYFSASNFHFSPGAPILKSWDLVNWEPIGHSIPRLDFGAGYNLPTTGERAYRGGTWASTLRYRKSNGLWYWIGCTNFWNTWVFTAPSVQGPWTNKAHIGGWADGICYYDCGMLIDDDDTLYVAYGNPDTRIAQLAPDGLSQVRSEKVFGASDLGADFTEGNRMYKINGTYYILNCHPGGAATYIWKSKSPWGPYEHKLLARNEAAPLQGGSSPNQGSLIQSPSGEWYFMSFTWAYPAGRMPVLAPLTWGADGFPSLVRGSNGGWGTSYQMPAEAQKPATGWATAETFAGPALGPKWEWNHNPDETKFTVDNGLTLRTATVTSDIYAARNTLTHRIHGEYPRGTVEIDFTNAADGDRFGLAAFRDRSAYIGVHRDGAEYSVVAAFNQTQDEWGSGQVQDAGRIVAEAPLAKGVRKVWFRLEMDARANGTKRANFFYSTDGRSFGQLGGSYELYTNWAWFLAYRFAIFNFASKALGGSILVESFTAA